MALTESAIQEIKSIGYKLFQEYYPDLSHEKIKHYMEGEFDERINELNISSLKKIMGIQ